MADDEGGLSEGEIALMDAFKTLAELFMYAHPGSENYLIRSFEHQIKEKIRTSQPHGAAMLLLLRDFVASPERAANREGVRKLLAEAPKGQA